MNRKVLLVAAMLAFVAGCISPYKKEKIAATVKAPSICGHWEGTAPDKSAIGYIFANDGTVLWNVAGQSIHAKYQVRSDAGLLDVDIFDFDIPNFQGVRFLGIARIDGKRMTFFGIPSKDGRTEDGSVASRPTEFGSDAIVFDRCN